MHIECILNVFLFVYGRSEVLWTRESPHGRDSAFCYSSCHKHCLCGATTRVSQ